MTVHAPTTPDYYRELEVDPAASTETIRAAYMALAKRHHPDLNPSRSAAERMQRLNDAYAVLGGEKRRRAYDAVRAHQFPATVEPSSAVAADSASALATIPAGLLGSRLRLGRGRATLLASTVGAASAVLLIVCLLLAARMIGRGSARAAPAATAVSSIVRRQTSAGASTSISLVHASDVVIAAASYPGFPQVDGLRDVAHSLTGATAAWTFQELGCTVLVGEYDNAEGTVAAIAYWRGAAHADEVDSGNVVAGVLNCADPAARAIVIAGLRDFLAHPAPAAMPPSASPAAG